MAVVPTLETERFILRPIRREDTAALFPTLSDEGQCRYLTRAAFASEAELEGWLFEPGWPGRTWITEDRATGEVTARLVAVPGDEAGDTEIGYITVREWQGRGVARECAAALITHLFEADGDRKVIAGVDPDNTPSIRLLEALGFTKEAHFREHETTHLGVRDALYFGLLRREWTSR